MRLVICVGGCPAYPGIGLQIGAEPVVRVKEGVDPEVTTSSDELDEALDVAGPGGLGRIRGADEDVCLMPALGYDDLRVKSERNGGRCVQRVYLFRTRVKGQSFSG